MNNSLTATPGLASKPPAKFGKTGDLIFGLLLKLSGIIVILLLLGIFVTLWISSWESISKFGLSFIWSDNWDPVNRQFGALPFIAGTALTSFLSLIISTVFSFAIALFLGEYHPRGTLASLLRSGIELLAAIPSVIYGFWAMFYLVPLIQQMEMKLDVPPYGVGILTASLVLSIMIMPFSASLATEVVRMVPRELKEAAYAMGATRQEVITQIILPYSLSGLFAGVLLALGRAIGETMAVTMVIGNANSLPDSIFAPANTMASLIANEFSEATGDIYLSAIIEIGLLLFAISFIINILGRLVIRQVSK